jgi:DNA-binding HxlR family transcriptional regulator
METITGAVTTAAEPPDALLAAAAYRTQSADGRFDVMSARCPTRQVLDRVADTWTALVLYALEPGTLRFSQLRVRVDGISQKMLTQTLRALERDGLLRREVFATVPARVEYTLTPLGHELAGVIAGIRVWAYRHMDEIDEARARYARAAGV